MQRREFITRCYIVGPAMKFIKGLLVVALAVVIFSVTTEAGSPEASYLASRDRYIDKLKPTDNNIAADDRFLKEEQLAKDDLQKQLHKIIGPSEIEGFSGPGKINLDTLSKGDLGFGLLDGLLYSSPDEKTRVIMTTDVLLDHWLREHRAWWGPTVANVPLQIDAALKSEAFYTQAINGDAAVLKYVELPVTKPANAKFAFAMLAARSQDIDPMTPDELIVSVVRGGHVFVMSAPANIKIDPMPACQEVWQESERKGSYAAFHRCFSKRAKTEGFFVVLTRQAQALIDRLPLR